MKRKLFDLEIDQIIKKLSPYQDQLSATVPTKKERERITKILPSLLKVMLHTNNSSYRWFDGKLVVVVLFKKKDGSGIDIYFYNNIRPKGPYTEVVINLNPDTAKILPWEEGVAEFIRLIEEENN